VLVILNVLHVYRTYFPDSQGGAEEVIRQICCSTANCGVKSRILALSRSPAAFPINLPEAEVFQFPVTAAPASCEMSVSALTGFKRLLKWADIVHYHFPWPFADMLHLAFAAQKPSIVTYHSDLVRAPWVLGLYAPLMHSFLARVSSIVATSPAYARSSKVLNRYCDKVEVIPIGVDESKYPLPDKLIVSRVRQVLGGTFFLFVGVLRVYKGLDYLVDALVGTNLKVVVAGVGPEEKRLKAYAASNGVTGIYWAGFVSDEEKVALMQACRGIVFPSHLRSEAFGVTLVEGAMFGKPLISTEMGTGTSYVNLHGVSGEVVPPANADALREAMLRFWHDSLYASRLGQQARQRYLQCFTADVMGNGYFTLYEKLLSN
jgi:rhamnosyl/mannosyltransferase